MNAGNRYIDLQVNGYAGVDFNSGEPETLTAEQLHHACEALDRDGVAGTLATVISDTIDVMQRRLRRLVELREADPLARRIIVGLHVEGPFLNERDGYRGAHPLEAMLPANEDAMQRLLDAGAGLVRLVTLAPERDKGMKVIRRLAGQNILVSAGHSDASLDELRAAVDAGLRMFTHLGNGCPMTMHRHDNIIQRCLHLRDALVICFIADGVHVPYVALANYLALLDNSRTILVSDAMAAAGLGPGRYTLGRWEIEVGDDLAAWAPGRAHLVGSAMTMRQAEANLRDHLRLDAAAIEKLTAANAGALLDELAGEPGAGEAGPPPVRGSQ